MGHSKEANRACALDASPRLPPASIRFVMMLILVFGAIGLCWSQVQSATLPISLPSSSPEPDELWFHQGESQFGQLETEILHLQTPYGLLGLPAGAIRHVQLSQGPHLLDSILTANSNRFSGFLTDRTFEFRSAAQTNLVLPREQIRRITLNRLSSNGTNSPKSCWIHLRNGDLCSGILPGDSVQLPGPQETQTIQISEIESISFSEGPSRRIEVRLLEGESRQGTWPDRNLEIALDIGLTLSLHPTRIARISRQLLTNAPVVGGHRFATNDLAPSHFPGMVWIRAGTFTMGSPVEEADRDLDEGPLTQVTLTRGFWMGVREVTQAEYQAIMNTNPSLFVGDPQRPVEKVRHRDAREYCARLTQQHQAEGRLPEHHAYRLPTEAEWEYACRAGTSTRFSHGNDPELRQLEEYAWFNGNSNSSTHPVGTRKPNPWGLYDTQGNVLEWCLDGSTSELPGNTVVDYQAPAEGILRIARGGSWLYDAKACRSANRDSYSESTRSSDLGFRIVLAPVEP